VVVENDAMSRELSRRVLIAGGYEVVCVGDAEEALRVVAGLQPDLVLMDLKLPGIDGIEATKRLRGSRKTASVPIAVLSAQAFGEEIERARQAGCIDYLTKPIGARQLLERVRALVGDEPVGAGSLKRVNGGRR
jgi:CheY-like chemotaxis protein